ncbi:dihydroorotase [Thermosphaera aggregans]|jgi:dihydroorotase (multifunctional complex type)|uniref:Amidohydrolase n=1 Tax=Thermosphaera aggregans (strain DSM 11486 / M11TL) TaxID=633148 RepID=D5U113_THEAM|nr:dihydroorotase family protein [Thermosphaera aggregans]ADG90813.1 amidohydrolase [Thermosphaera aggregans DSM 11486]
MRTILLKNVKIPVGGELVEGSILIEDKVIRAVSKKTFEADEVLDGNGLLAVPGGIDVHAHVYDPDNLEHEDWRSGSLAASYGGITTLIDMPLRVFVDKTETALEKIQAARRESYINYGLTGGFLNEQNYNAIEELEKIGVKTFKVFTCRPFQTSDKGLGKIFEKAAEKNVAIIAHAEDEGLLTLLESRYRVRDDIEAYHLSRSPWAEAAAVLKLGYYSLETGARLHIAHLSSKEGVDALAFLKSKNPRVTAETCPHYLFFTREDSKAYGTYLKMAPTLKTSIDREALWNALETGLVEVYASDNAPSPRSLKEKDVWSAWGGIPNLEIMGPFLFTYGVLKGRISLQTFINVFSRNPAKLLGLYPLLGEIFVGSLADIVVLNTREPRHISSKTHHHKVDWTPWEGLSLYGHPYYLMVHGELIIEKGELVGEPGTGVYVGELGKVGMNV